VRRMNESDHGPSLVANDRTRLAAFQHEHVEFSYASEPNGLNARVCIIHIRAIANIIAVPGQPRRYSLAHHHCRESGPLSQEITPPQFGAAVLTFDYAR